MIRSRSTTGGSVGTLHSYSVATTSCNIGDIDLLWIANTNQPPVIAQNIFRLRDNHPDRQARGRDPGPSAYGTPAERSSGLFAGATSHLRLHSAAMGSHDYEGRMGSWVAARCRKRYSDRGKDVPKKVRDWLELITNPHERDHEANDEVLGWLIKTIEDPDAA